MKPLVILAAVLSLTAVASGQATRPSTQPSSSRVVFIIDGTGSMLGRQDAIATEIEKAVEAMGADQSIGVVIAVEPKPLILSPALKPASPATAKLAADFIRKFEAGGSDQGFTAALAAVVKLRPDVVWFISDGDMQDYTKTPKMIGSAAKGFRINTTTAFCRTQDPISDEIEGLRRIATLSGGSCVDRDGKRLDPTKEAKAVAKPPATGPSIFRE